MTQGKITAFRQCLILKHTTSRYPIRNILASYGRLRKTKIVRSQVRHEETGCSWVWL